MGRFYDGVIHKIVANFLLAKVTKIQISKKGDLTFRSFLKGKNEEGPAWITTSAS